MNAMLPLFVSTLGWALINFLWQGALLGLAAAIALMALRNARPQTRYAVCCATLALCLALPMASIWRGMHVDASVAATPVAAAPQFIAMPTQIIVAPLGSWRSGLQDQLPWIVALWSIGAGLLALRMAMGMMWVERIGRSDVGMGEPRWQARLDRLAAALGLQSDIRLRLVDRLDSPAAAGWWRPMVLVPAMLVTRMSPDLLEALLAHELAHIKRHDYLVNLLQSAIEALLFYHPVVWWLSRQIRIEREQIADDLAATALGDPRRLALALDALDQFQLDHPLYPATQLVAAATGGNLMSRIQRLIRPSQHALSWKMSLPIIGLAAFCLTVYAHGVAPVAKVPTVAPVIFAGTTAVTVAAADKGQGTHIYMNSDHPQPNAYAVVRAGEDGFTMSGDSHDIPAIEKTQRQIHGDFIWMRRGSKTYVVQDPALIAKVTEARKPADALNAQMQTLDAKMQGPSQHLEELSRQMEALQNSNHPDSEAIEKTGAQMQALASKQQAIAEKMGAVALQREDGKLSDEQAESAEAQMQALQAQMAPLDRQMQELSAVMQQQSQKIEGMQQPAEAISRQMEEASKPMEAIGKQMEVLGKQIEQEAKAADRATNALLDDALRNGKAVPMDGVLR